MTQEAVLRFSLPSATAQALRDALAPETSHAPDVPKARAVLDVEEGALVVTIAAEDLSALRAAINSYLRWIDAAERAARVAG